MRSAAAKKSSVLSFNHPGARISSLLLPETAFFACGECALSFPHLVSWFWPSGETEGVGPPPSPRSSVLIHCQLPGSYPAPFICISVCRCRANMRTACAPVPVPDMAKLPWWTSTFGHVESVGWKQFMSQLFLSLPVLSVILPDTRPPDALPRPPVHRRLCKLAFFGVPLALLVACCRCRLPTAFQSSYMRSGFL